MTLKPIYLDFNATTPLSGLVKSQLPQWLEEWGNASSIHWAGRGPKALLRDARNQIAQMLGCEALELIFTSGGSEANNLALKGVLENLKFNRSCRQQIIISAVEHPSVVKAAQYLKRMGFKLDVIPVNRDGEIDLASYQNLLGEQTALVSVMYANNETGHIFPIQKMAQMAHEAGALFHCDGVQALGKSLVNVREWGVDLATFSGHKFYALKGCGVLYCRKGIQIESLIHGGGQERGRRAGTENLLAIASLGAMATQSLNVSEKILQMRELRDLFEQRVLQEISDIHIVGASGTRVPNTSSLMISGVDGETLLMNLDVRGYAVSTGAACSSGSPEPSPVLLAMGYQRQEAQSSLRLSLGWDTQASDIEAFVDTLKTVVARLRSFRHGEKFLYGV